MFFSLSFLLVQKNDPTWANHKMGHAQAYAARATHLPPEVLAPRHSVVDVNSRFCRTPHVDCHARAVTHVFLILPT
jgi:hypothetical protein